MIKPNLSIIILSYNTKELLKACLLSLMKVSTELEFETIVVDNASSDGSVTMVKNEFKWVRLVESKRNLGFAGGNNLARKLCHSKFVLFLNSDTIVYKNALSETVNYLDQNTNVGALTCNLVMPDGSLDRDARRSFINPWIGLIHLFLKLDRIFPKSKLLARYWYGYMPDEQIHEVDVIQGAFFLARKEVLDDVGWFDEDYFLDGEDIDLCWRIKKKGWKIIYFPKVSILHIKGASKGKNKLTARSVSLREKLKYRMAGVNSMEIFLRKRLWSENSLFVNLLMLFGIRLLKLTRVMKVILTG